MTALEPTEPMPEGMHLTEAGTFAWRCDPCGTSAGGLFLTAWGATADAREHRDSRGRCRKLTSKAGAA